MTFDEGSPLPGTTFSWSWTLTFADPIEVVLEPSFSTDTVTVATVLPSKTEDAMPPHAGVGVAPVAFWTQTSNFVS